MAKISILLVWILLCVFIFVSVEGWGRRRRRSRYLCNVDIIKILGRRWKDGLRSGTYVGAEDYRRRRRYDVGKPPQICHNPNADTKYSNQSGEDGSRFLCPRYDQTDEYECCCGPNDQQKCCTRGSGEHGHYWTTGKIVGTVMAIICIVMVVCLVAYCCKRKKARARMQRCPDEVGGAPVYMQGYPGAVQSPSMTGPYPREPPPPGYPAQPYPAGPYAPGPPGYPAPPGPPPPGYPQPQYAPSQTSQYQPGQYPPGQYPPGHHPPPMPVYGQPQAMYQ